MSLIYDALRQSAPTGAGAAASASSAHRPSMHWWRRPLPWLVAGMLVAGPLGFLIARQGAPAAREATAPVAPVAPVAAGAATAARAPQRPDRSRNMGKRPVRHRPGGPFACGSRRHWTEGGSLYNL